MGHSVPLAAATRLGPYEIVSPLGAGGMGEVYLAADMAVERQVAIKVIRTDISLYSTQEEFRAAVRLFNREANAIARLDHPHILPSLSVERNASTARPSLIW